MYFKQGSPFWDTTRWWFRTPASIGTQALNTGFTHIFHKQMYIHVLNLFKLVNSYTYKHTCITRNCTSLVCNVYLSRAIEIVSMCWSPWFQTIPTESMATLALHTADTTASTVEQLDQY